MERSILSLLAAALVYAMFPMAVAAGDAAGGAYPNEPEGYVPWFRHDCSFVFENEGRTAASHVGFISPLFGGNRAHESRPAGDDTGIIDGPVAPHGMDHEWRIKFATGTNFAGGSPSCRWLNADGGDAAQPRLREVYVHFWILLEAVEGPDADWPYFQHPAVVLRFGYWQMGNNTPQGQVIVGVDRPRNPDCELTRWEDQPSANPAFSYPAARARHHVGIRNFEPGNSATGWTGALGADTCQFVIGRWHRMEYQLLLNDLGESNGVFREWRDGTLVRELTGLEIRLRGASAKLGRELAGSASGSEDWTDGFFAFRHHMLYNNNVHRKTRDDHVRMTDLYISGVYEQE